MLSASMENNIYPGRVGIQQRVLPSYRGAFFDLLAKHCEDGLSVFSGKALEKEEIPPGVLKVARQTQAKNWHFRDPSSSVYLCWQGGIIGWLERWNPDVLFVEANPRCLSTNLAMKWMHERGRQVIGWGLGVQAARGKMAWLNEWMRKKFYAQFDKVIAYSHNGASDYINHGFSERQVFLAPNSSAHRPVQKNVERSITSERLNVLYVGRLQKRKRIDDLIIACSKLPDRLKPVLVIVGDGPARNDFEEIARIYYPDTEFTGFKQGIELDRIFESANLFVLPGTGGLAVQQALGHSLPVIVAQGDGSQDDMVRPSNGWRVTPGDIESLTRVLNEALSQPERLLEMGKESFRIAYEEINIERMVEGFLQALYST